MKSIAVSYLIFSLIGPNWKSGKTNMPILTSLVLKKNPFTLPMSFLISLRKEAPSESHLKMLQMLIPPGPMPLCKFISRMPKRPFPKSLLSTWPEIKEAPITWTKTNKLKLMVPKSTNPYSHLKSVSEPSIKEKATPLSEAANLPWCSKTHSSDSAKLSWLVTFLQTFHHRKIPWILSGIVFANFRYADRVK